MQTANSNTSRLELKSIPPPDDDLLRRFLAEHIESFEQLELLLAMMRDPTASLTVDSAAVGVNMPPDEARDALEHLAAHGFCSREKDSTFRYAPVPGVRPGAALLASVHAESPVRVAGIMSDNAIHRMEGMAARAFADAFLFPRRKSHDG